jgi:hypothetical protein
MIAVTRTASIAPGKTGDAMAYAHHIAKYVKDKHGTTFEVLMPIGGNPARIAWHARLASLAEWETLTTKLLADRTYVELVSQNSALFLPGSVRDTFWRSV